MIIRKILMTLMEQEVPTDVLGPGPTTLALGDMSAGYFGPVESSLIFSATSLRAALGITTGSIWNDTPQWIKFAHNGLIKYIPEKPLAYSITWQDLYLAGAVYPEKNTGNFPPTGQTPTLQGREITNSQGYKFSSALISIGSDPVPLGAIPSLSSEYALINRLMNGTWGTSTYTDWGVNNFSPYLWVMQSHTANTNTKLSVSNLSNNIDGYSTDPNDTRTILHWRPILTLR